MRISEIITENFTGEQWSAEMKLRQERLRDLYQFSPEIAPYFAKLMNNQNIKSVDTLDHMARQEYERAKKHSSDLVSTPNLGNNKPYRQDKSGRTLRHQRYYNTPNVSSLATSKGYKEFQRNLSNIGKGLVGKGLNTVRDTLPGRNRPKDQ